MSATIPPVVGQPPAADAFMWPAPPYCEFPQPPLESTPQSCPPWALRSTSRPCNLAHSLKLNVVAEGVATEGQSRLLRCDEMQGFLSSKPVPAELFEAKFLAPPRAD